jgi:ABC-type uncharacterized transport system auxiliary subunit
MIERMKREGQGLTMKRSVRVTNGGNAFLLSLLCGCIFLTSCAKAKPVHYYQITYPASTLASANSLDVAILVRNFFAPHLYREDLIVFSSSSEEMGTYQNQRWAEPPTEMLQNALVRGLRASGRFRSVLALRSDSQGDYIVTGRLYDFREMDADGVKAQLSFDMEMRELHTGKMVWTYAYNHDEPASGKDVAGLAAAMDKNVQRSVQEVQSSLAEYFKNHPPK